MALRSRLLFLFSVVMLASAFVYLDGIVTHSLLFQPPRAPLDPGLGGHTLCLQVYTGTIRSTVVLSNPRGISGFQPYRLANFEQRVLSQSPTQLEIEITSQRYLDTHASYPIDITRLPYEVQEYVMLPSRRIQSNDPLIVTQARKLVAGASRQVEAVNAIVAWMRGNIAYGGTSNDALSVFRNRSGVCSGFTNLTVAMLRAVGIPARYHSGCLAQWGDGLRWQSGETGTRHAWVTVYYPDVGWVGLEPQASSHYVDTAHIFGGFSECEQEGTVIQRTAHWESGTPLYSLSTPYIHSAWPTLRMAQVPGQDARVAPATLITSSAGRSTENPAAQRGCGELAAQDLFGLGSIGPLSDLFLSLDRFPSILRLY